MISEGVWWGFSIFSIVMMITVIVILVISSKKRGTWKKRLKVGMIEKHEWKNIAVVGLLTFFTFTLLYSMKAIMQIRNPLAEGVSEGFIASLTFIIFAILGLYLAQSRLDRDKRANS